MSRNTTLILSLLVSIASIAQSLPMKLWYNSPAEFFEESMPIGNGRLGALVYGGTDDNVIQFNDITFWTGKPVNRNDDEGAHKWIPEIRKALFNEDYKLADSLQLHVQGNNSQFYQPLATLHILDDNTTKASGYYRELDIDSALCRDTYIKGGVRYTREYFASNPDKMIAMRIRADKKGAINCLLSLTSLVPHKVRSSQTSPSGDHRRASLTINGHATGDPMNSIHFSGILTAKTDGGKVLTGDSTLLISGATEATVYFVNATSFNGFDKHPVNEGTRYIEQAADDAWHLVNYTYDQLRERHIADYKAIYDRFKLKLGNATFDTKRNTEQQLKDYTDRKGGNTYLETLYAQYGRYLLISCSRTAGVPANLQGLWTPHLWSPWRGNYTVNINLEENYWPAEVANMGEMAMPLDNFIAALAANGRYTAKNYYGITEGWCSSHNSDIWAMTNPVGEKREWPEWANWNMGGAWLVNALWDHYLFNLDIEYLRSTAYPLMKGAAEFCMAWLIKNPNNPDELITAPSTSPENEYKTDKGYHGMTMYGGTADLAIIRELLTNTIKASETLNTDKELRDRMNTTINMLHPYKIGKRGNLQEWYYDWDDWDWKHRHQSHLIGLYPGRHITEAQPELMKACRKSLEIKGDETTGWSTGWRINLWARLKDADQAYHIYQKLLTYVSPDNYKGEDKRRSGGTYPNLFDAHPPFQIDGNFGGTAGVCEMLVQSDGDTITLLPALPKAWKDGEVSGICARGGYELKLKWTDSKVVELTVKAKNKGKVKVAVNGRIITVKTKADKCSKVI
ncbi:MAG: glycoside hydrolase N-terminal domain-containing protein [Prevotella sp.]|nr:glycoside hydrolase N-terminal domain-containing protein [Prevotella sp.]